jgi:hypothetical protein
LGENIIYLTPLETNAIGQAKAATPTIAAFHQGEPSTVRAFAIVDKNGMIYLHILFREYRNPATDRQGKKGE